MNLPQYINKEEVYGAADTHIHSSASDGMASVTEILEYVANMGTLDVIAITDHAVLSGSYEARELAARRNYPFEVVTGMEINTLQGHLLVLFLENPIPNRLPLADTIAAAHAQGALCIAPHPANPLSESITCRDMENIANNENTDIYFDGIETCNATIMGFISNKRARGLNRKYKLAETGGSDAHFLVSIGSGLTLFKGHTAEDLRRSIIDKTTKTMKGRVPSYFEIGIMQILRQQKKSRSFFVRGIVNNAIRQLRR